MQQSSVLDNETLHAATASLLQAAGLGGNFSLRQLPGGGNNRVFRVEINGLATLLKAYFQHPEDPRDRLGAEYSFCAFSWKNGLRALPRPLALDVSNRLGLYEFIDGRKLLPEEINEGTIRQALTFFADVNNHRHSPDAQKLPLASEAFFTLTDHLQCIESRLAILRDIDRSSTINQEAADFVRDQFAPAWDSVRRQVESRARSFGQALETEIPRDDRRLSPSDFGFHNAILTANGRLRFLDFEYAGWDDPAKMVCDFFCQVAIPMPAAYFDMMVESVTSGLSEPGPFRGRLALLMPVYRVKWCCIVLNEFVRVSGSRRRFAHVDIDPEEKKVIQLQKARCVLRSVTDERGIYYGLH
ncbi:MAG TPA: aminoglycoside phosphotransferase family protein [Gemmataceae bacterium]|jgi:thiamine kinase-like enzyme|nr:aminoglycoside phosphotransferase family protein [Gemmataceae bacterium]